VDLEKGDKKEEFLALPYDNLFIKNQFPSVHDSAYNPISIDVAVDDALWELDEMERRSRENITHYGRNEQDD
jgi:hypothetical protein